MRAVIILTTLFFTILQPPTPTPHSLPLPEYWPHGCEVWGVALIEPISQAFDYGSACETYRQCDPDNNRLAICELSAARVLLQSCVADDPDCQRQSLLFAAAIHAFDSRAFGFTELISRADVVERIRAGLQAFVNADLETALYAYNFTSDRYFNHMIPFSRGLVYEELENDEQALTAYQEALDIVPNDPLVRYARARLYGRLDQEAFAAFDAYWLAEFTANDPELSEMVEPLVEAHPLELEQFENWVMYPLIVRDFGPAGDFYMDQTGMYGRPVRLRIDRDAGGVFVLDLFKATAPFETFYYGERSVDAYFLKQNFGDESRFTYYRQINPDPEATAAYRLEIDVSEEGMQSDIYTGETAISQFERNGQTRFVLTPADNHDPRVEIRENACGVISRFDQGMSVRSASFHTNTQFFDQPDSDSLLESEGLNTTFTLTGDSQCIQNENGPTLWWPAITDEGIEGWIPENDGNAYLFNPVDEAEQWLTLE